MPNCCCVYIQTLHHLCHFVLQLAVQVHAGFGRSFTVVLPVSFLSIPVQMSAMKRKKNIMRSTFSSSLDDFTLMAARARHAAGIDDAETPNTHVGHDDFSFEPSAGPEALHAMSYPAPSRENRSLAASSVPLDAGVRAAEESPQNYALFQPGFGRLGSVKDKYVIFVLDNTDTAKRLANLLARKGKALLGLASGGQSVGVGVASTYNLANTSAMMKDAGLAMSDLDFAITNAGSEIWYSASGLGLKGSDPVLDEQYEALIEAKWDKVSVRRVLWQNLSSKGFLPGLKASDGGAKPKIKVDTETGAHHLMVTLQKPEGGDGSGLSPGEQTALLNRIKGRFRRSGIRTQLLSQYDEDACKVHITPLRASRALALRYLAHKHKVNLDNLVLITCATGLQGAGLSEGAQLEGGIQPVEGRTATFAASDVEDLVSGKQGVLVVPPGKANGEVQGFEVDLGLYQHYERVQLLQPLK